MKKDKISLYQLVTRSFLAISQQAVERTKSLSLASLGVLFGIGLCISPTMASPGSQWLAQQNQVDGSYTTAGDVATVFQATSETLRTFKSLGETAQPGIANAIQFINSEPYLNTEYLSRRIINNVELGVFDTAALGLLKTHQNIDGGFGELVGHNSTILDTAYALDALVLAGEKSSEY